MSQRKSPPLRFMLVLLLAAFALAALAADAGARNVYVANSASNTLSVINSRTSQVIGAPLPVGSGPEGIAITGDGTTAYVADEGSSTVAVVDLQTRQVVGAPIPVIHGPDKLAVSPDGRTVVAVSFFGSTISVIDTASRQVARFRLATPLTGWPSPPTVKRPTWPTGDPTPSR